MSSNLNLSIGIDLGTTNSCAAIFRNGKVEIIPNDLGSHTTPSYVAFTENQRFVGQPAKDQLIKNLTNTIFSIKRLMGRNWDDRFVQKEIKKFPFEVKEENSRPYVRIERAKKGKRTFSAEEISAMILKKIVKSAEVYLNEEIKNVVITVPAYFNDAQRQATKNAGIIAGLNVLRIINEPTAAAIAYGLHSVKDEKTIVVYDLGGGTLDVSILKIKDGSLTVLATCGNSHLGGEDFDQNVINYFIKWYKTRKNIDFTNNNRAIQRLRKEVEKSKRLLTFSRSSTIEINSFLDDEDFSETLTRAKFEELNRDLFYSTLESLRQALMDAKLTKNDIDEIVMVGGSSRIPKIQEIVKFFFNGKEPFHQINPDEAVAYGAAIQAAILTGQQDSLKIQDVNPLSLGFAIKSNRMKIMIPRNTSIPTKKIDKVTTSKDFQKTMSFSLYEGEIPIASENLFLGKLRLTDIESAPKGVPKIEVKFEIDENGILEVFAENIVTNEKQNINIDYQKNRPTKAEIDEMIKISGEYDKLEENYNKTVNLRIELTELVYDLKESVEINNITNNQKIKLQKIVDDNLKWLEVQKIYSIEEYEERIEQIKNAVSSIVFEPTEE